MISCLELQNFTVFDHLRLELSSKINVIIGENGTGKTHLLKAAYSLCGGASLLKNKPDISRDEFEIEMTTKLLRIFMPLNDKLGRMHARGTTGRAELRAEFSQGQKITAYFSNNSKALKLSHQESYGMHHGESVFIPTKEVLSFMKGFTSLYDKYGLSFDQTYRDICLLLDLAEIRPDSLKEKSKWAMKEIEDICNGRFIFHGGGDVTFKTGKIEYSANAAAEGFRKAGILSRLLETGAIQPGVSGPLFWDEPEANMNPKLMKLFVQILLELSRNGQQVIIATHDYVLLKWFDLLMDEGEGDHAYFHSLYRDSDTGKIETTSTENFLRISPNPIDEAFGYLINQEIENTIKGHEKCK